MKLTAFGIASAAVANATTVTPLEKVLQMMDDMLAKGKAEKQKEETEFAAFQQWCDSTRDATTKSIADGASQIEQLTADIAKGEADAEQLGQEAEEELANADADQSELDKAQAIRDKELADYTATHTDLSESIDAVERAIAALKSREADVPQSLLQVQKSVQLSAEAKASIESLLALSAAQTPDANAYEFQGGGVVKMLEDLRLKFQDERLALEKTELASKSEFEVLKQRLTASVSEAKKDGCREDSDKGTTFGRCRNRQG
jgi:chromosome segregation ATPase